MAFRNHRTRVYTFTHALKRHPTDLLKCSMIERAAVALHIDSIVREQCKPFVYQIISPLVVMYDTGHTGSVLQAYLVCHGDPGA
jgi:hypothetical protein